MLFSSSQFPVFFALFFLVFFALPRAGRGPWVLISSAYFYSSVAVQYLWVLAVLIACDFVVALILVRQQRALYRLALLLVGILANLTLLFWFKWQFENSQVFYPPGLSFHTFQSIAYLVEVYKQRFEPEQNIATYARYILFWPQLVAGPVERPQGLLKQLRTDQRVDSHAVLSGMQLVLLGAVKKLVIADRLATLVAPAMSNPAAHSGWPLWWALVLLAFQFYCDFSGYTDIARGSARMMGIQLVENFAQPFFARNPVDFWRRWHMSLTSWFRDYVYIPLVAGSPSPGRPVLATLVVFAAIGIWHAPRATMILWGLYQGMIVLSTRVFSYEKLGRAGAPVTFALIVFGFGLFTMPTVSFAVNFYASLFAPASYGLEVAGVPVAVGLAVITLSLVIDSFQTTFAPVWYGLPRGVRLAVCNLGLIAILLFGQFENRAFIYYQF